MALTSFSSVRLQYLTHKRPPHLLFLRLSLCLGSGILLCLTRTSLWLHPGGKLESRGTASALLSTELGESLRTNGIEVGHCDSLELIGAGSRKRERRCNYDD